MPTTRRSAASTRGRTGPAKGQATISFSGRVTKALPQDTKKAIVDSPAVGKVQIPERPAPAKEELTEDEAAKVEVEEPEEAVEELEIESKEEAVVQEKTEAEIKAEKITDVQIKSYWGDIEKQRKTPRIHQEGLDLSEKVLRYFDMSSHYGPCIGLPRLKRWQRAERLGLNPPIEVLAVLLKEEQKGNDDSKTAQMDRVLNATALAS